MKTYYLIFYFFVDILLLSRKKTAMNYGYIRVSSEKQTVENQRYEIMQYCKRKGLVIDRWIEESVSGARHPNVRKLGKILHKINKGDIIYVTELSRLGRCAYMVIAIISHCLMANASIIEIRDDKLVRMTQILFKIHSSRFYSPKKSGKTYLVEPKQGLLVVWLKA